MAVRSVYLNNVLRERWNDDATATTDVPPIPARNVRFYDATGAILTTRTYTAAESTAADAAAAALSSEANKRQTMTNLQSDLATFQARISQTNSTLTAEFNSNPAPMLKEIYRALRRLDQIALGDFSNVT